MSDISRGPGWWRASDGRWYPPETHPNYRRPSTQSPGPGWWIASDGNWYPPETHPDNRPAPEAAPTATIPAERTLPVTTVAAETRRRPPRRTVGTDLGNVWRQRRGFRIALIVVGGLVALAMLGGLLGEDDDSPSEVLTGPTTTLAPAFLVAPTGEATTTSTTTTAVVTTTEPATTATTPATTAATAPPATAAPTTTAVRQGVTPGAFCSPEGARGVTSNGVAMACTTTAADSRARWRAA